MSDDLPPHPLTSPKPKINQSLGRGYQSGYSRGYDDGFATAISCLDAHRRAQLQIAKHGMDRETRIRASHAAEILKLAIDDLARALKP